MNSPTSASLARATVLDLNAYLTYRLLLTGRSTYRIRYEDRFGGATTPWERTKRLYHHNLARKSDNRRVVPTPETPEWWASRQVDITAIQIHTCHRMLKHHMRHPDERCSPLSPAQAAGYLLVLRELGPLPPGRYRYNRWGQLTLNAYYFHLSLCYTSGSAVLKVRARRHWHHGTPGVVQYMCSDGKFDYSEPPGYSATGRMDLADPHINLQACRRVCQAAYAEFLQVMKG